MKNRRYIMAMVGMLLMMGVSSTAYGQTVKGRIFGGGQLATVTGSATDTTCIVTINSGEVYGKVYAAGEGLKKGDSGYSADVAKVTGHVKVKMKAGSDGGGTAWQDVFGGAALAKVVGSSFVEMSGGHIAANLFGGGEGDINADRDGGGNLVVTSADITGNTNLSITGGDIVWNRTSLTESKTESVITHIFTNTTAGSTTYETSDGDENNESVKALYELMGYTVTSVGDRTESAGSYSFTVNYSKIVLTYTDVDLEKEGKTLDEKKTELAAYEYTSKAEERTYVTGDIISWDTTKPSTYYDTDNKIDNRLFYDDDTHRFKIKHNIFGGGYVACRVGTYDEEDGTLADNTGKATISMVSGMFGGDLMGTDQWKLAYNNNQDPHFYVFGGGFGAFTSVGNTSVHIGVDAAINDSPSIDTQWSKPLRKPAMETAATQQRSKGLNMDGNSINAARALDEEPLGGIGIFDDSYGLPKYTILGVLGGGYAGLVTGNTDVMVGGNTFMHRIYGGGYGQLAAFNELKPETDKIFPHAAATLNDLTRENLGVVMGNTYVETQGGFIHGDVFGGGAGVESAYGATEYFELDDDHTTASKDFIMGNVRGITEVKIGGNTEIYGNVYGGGDVACVEGTGTKIKKNGETATNTTDVAVVGGVVTGDVFGGGSGRKAAMVTLGSLDNHTVQVGSVTGNTLVMVENDVLKTDAEATEYNTMHGLTGEDMKQVGDIVSEPYIYGSIYGGGAYGQVKKTSNDSSDGNTVVTVNAGYIGDNIFGGGLGDEAKHTNSNLVLTSANIAGNTTVSINGGSALWSAISDNNGNTSTWSIKSDVLKTEEDRLAVRMALVTGDTEVFKRLLANVDDKFFDVNTLEFKKNHNVYGGGDKVCKVAGNATVTVNHALVTEATLLDPNNEAGLAWAASIDNKEHPQFSVFGGGYGPNTSVANTTVNYQCGKNEILYTPNDPEVIGGTKHVGEHKDDYTYANQIADRTMWLRYFGGIAQAWNEVPDAEKEKNYGGNNSAGVWRYAVSQLAWSPGIPNLIMRGIFGGGYAGLVEGNTNVTVSDFSCMRYVYGGGLGSKDYLDKYDKDDATALYNRLGEVGRNATVVLSGGVVSKELYGGGAGIEPKKLGEDTDFTDLVDMARVKGKTNVVISGSPSVTETGAKGTVIIGDVFGGGDVANVGTVEGQAYSDTNSDSKIDPQDDNFVTSQVIINSGCMLGQVFAGGNGRTKAQCNEYKNVGAIYGNTLLTVNGYDESSSAGEAHAERQITYVFKRMFGGGNNGSIRKTTNGGDNSGHTYVTVNGGYFAYNVFGGGVGSIDYTVEGNTIHDNNTYSYVESDTHVRMLGGLAILDQYWDKNGMRQWAPLNEHEGKKYSSQYDPVQKKLLINHNVYAGCRNAGYVLGSTYLTMNKGYIRSNLRAGTYAGVADNFFESQEWEEIYNKIGSPHFCIFGGGYGEHTHIKGNTWVDININATELELRGEISSASILSDADYAKPASQRFAGGQTVMDIIGGGYSGNVAGATHVKITGDVYARRIFGGSFYAPVSQTNIQINSINCDDIFGGGMMGNVETTTVDGYHLADAECGKVNLVIGTPVADNSKIFINNNVYGGNDVSGMITGQITNSIFGGTIYNNVYGAGNGNYLYAVNERVKVVETHENYELNGQTYPLVYEVPKREEMEFSMSSATDAQKIVNINTYRPNAQKVILNLCGQDDAHKLLVKGNVFGGGNTATVNNLDNNASHTSVVMNIGSHCNIGGVYMGNDGDAMFQESNGFIDAFQKINGVDIQKPIQWLDNPMDKTISEQYLPVALADRPKIYPHVLDLYFQPVEMSLQPTLNWCSNIAYNSETEVVTPTPGAITNTTIGIFVAGGNRGNMNVKPAADGSIVNYEFPAGLTITNRIVGGCNNANYKFGNTNHVGGYLLGKRNTTKPAINLSVKCKFGLAKNVTLLNGSAIPTDANGEPIEQRNVYGGCYNSGTIHGDVNIDFRSTMLNTQNIGTTQTKEACDNIAKTYFGSEVAMGNVYGAGYGPESYVYGNTTVTVGVPVDYIAPEATPVVSDDPQLSKGMAKPKAMDVPMVDDDAYVAMSVYGGGQMGNVIGNTTVRVVNGHIGKSVVGGSYAGYMWGNTHVLVGYPTYYIANKGGKYKMARADKWNTAQTNHDNSKVVKDEIYVLPGDIISQEVYDAIKDYDDKIAKNTAQANTTNFTEHTTEAPEAYGLNWDNVKITIDEACYGGGYSLASGSSVAAGTYTVKKYDDKMNITEDYDIDDLKAFVNHIGNTSTKEYGGNTTVLVWDNNNTAQTKDHINISTQTMTEVTSQLADDTDLFGYYHKRADGTYGYIYQEGEYFFHRTAEGAQYYKQAFESDSEGGLYGDGHLSFAEGFRAGELVGYGFSGAEPNGAKVINTFQRMDMLRLHDCSVAVLGARDYTVNEISKTPYSIARIGELQMVAENVVYGDGTTQYKEATGSGTAAFAAGQLVPTTNAHSRNYLGLSNNIHYLGAVKSNVDFNAKYQYGNKDTGSHANGTRDNSKTYREAKQDYVTRFIDNPVEFQKRNDGTAANMIGISSGYAMKLLNVYTTTDATTESYFYGPIVGVVEMNLIDVREDEGGGYVYADNIHHRSTTAIDYSKGNYDQVPTAADQNEDFLEVSGNFVFPYDVQKNRYIVDDCFPTGFEGTEATAEGHYWYVTGYNYYYNAHITGYTYNSSTKSLYFNSDKDALLTLTGAKAGQQINLQSLKWRSNHLTTKGDGFVACDLETPAGDFYEDITSSLENGADVSQYFVKNGEGNFVAATGTKDSETHYYRKTEINEGYATVSLKNGDDLSGYYTSPSAGNYNIVASGTYDNTAGITYYNLKKYKDITATLANNANVSSYFTESGGVYTAATGKYVNGTKYYKLTAPDTYEEVTDQIKAACDVTSYYTCSGNTYTQLSSGYYADGTHYYVQVGNGNTPSTIEQDEKYIYDHYNLHMGTAGVDGKYFAEVQEVTPSVDTDLTKGYYTTPACNVAATGTADGTTKYYMKSGVQEVTPPNGTNLTNGYYTTPACNVAAEGTADGTTKYYTKTSYWEHLPLTTDLPSSLARHSNGVLTTAAPVLTFQLVDGVDNSGIDYYNQYMQQPCQATVVLTCPATEDDGVTLKKGYVPIPYFFTRTGSSPNYTYTKMADNTQLTAGTEYYYFGNGNDYHGVNSDALYYYSKEQQRYVPVIGDDAVADVLYANAAEYNAAKGTSLDADAFAALLAADKIKTKGHSEGPAIAAEDLKSGSQDYTFYHYTNRTYTYTVYLTIDYVQGPDVSGNLRVYNCALPGEKIKIDRGTIDIKSDQSMSQTAAIWKIFKEGTDEAKKYKFDQANPYDEEADVNTTSEMLKDVTFNETDKCLYVPAYYFMDGYKVEYSYRVNGIDQEFTVPAGDNDYIHIHNYHRMLPRAANGIDKTEAEMHLELAAQRYTDELTAAQALPESTEDERIAKAAALAAVHPQPRIYIADAMDLNELPRFLEEKALTYYTDFNKYNEAKGTELNATQFAALPSTKKIKGQGAVGSKYDFGNNMQFHLLNDITLKTEQLDMYKAPANFKGTLNGNGYVISGLGVKVGDHTPDAYLFQSNAGKIYNLGLKHGKIKDGDDGTTNSLYHTSYTWSNKTVYDMAGTAKQYTDNDFRYGKVAYDLNEYYLDARKNKLSSAVRVSDYVENLYSNGDYLYSRWVNDSKEFLRITNLYDANYNSATSYHNYTFNPETYAITHSVDEDRYVTDHYQPLYEETSIGNTSDVDKLLRNDYLFFGQVLNAATRTANLGTVNTTLPDHVTTDKTHGVDLMTNRMYRAAAVYASEASGDVYETSGGLFYYNADACVHDNGITSIDFHNYADPTTPALLYAPALDYRLTGINTAAGVTRNLLVYANTEDDITSGALKTYAYTESTAEGSIKLHAIAPTCNQGADGRTEMTEAADAHTSHLPTTAFLHIVERTAKDRDASGAACNNNDFDAPYAFTVTQRAWYTRQPATYSEAGNDAWEGICLPFTANKVVASLNGEITHFYGTPTEEQKTTPNTNDKNLHHEYWLRGLTAVAAGTGAQAGNMVASFVRPGAETGLFNPSDPSNSTIASFIYDNQWFKTTYGSKNYNWNDASNQNRWYTVSHTYENYKPLTAEIPYVVSFPGEQYYEFDLSSKFYNRMLTATEKAQTVTFNAYAHDYDGDVTNKATDAITIPATNVERMTSTAQLSGTNYVHQGTFLETRAAADVYAMTEEGTAFSAAVTAPVLPFRTYMYSTTASPSKQMGNSPDLIYIGSANAAIEEIGSEYGIDDSDEKTVDGMRIYPRGRRVIVESTYPATLYMHTVGGSLMRVLDVRPGVNTYSGFAEGIYIVGKKTISLH